VGDSTQAEREYREGSGNPPTPAPQVPT
jgi:hypothetical protein